MPGSHIPGYLPHSPAFGIYANITPNGTSYVTSYVTDGSVSCRKATGEDVPTRLPNASSATSFTAFYSATMLNPVTCLINIASAVAQAADGYLIIPLSDIFTVAGIGPTDGWRVMNYNVTPRRWTNNGYSVGYWASLWKPVSGIVGANIGSYPYDTNNINLGLLIAVDENAMDDGFEAGIIVSRKLN